MSRSSSLTLAVWLALVAGCGAPTSDEAELSDAVGPPDAASDTITEVADASHGDADSQDAPMDAGVPRSVDGGAEDLPTAPSENWGEPMETPEDTWTWVPFPETFCGDGSPTGIGVNLHPGASRLVIYLEGGGACWDYGNCFGIVTTSFHLGGYDEGSFTSLFAEVYKSLLFFDRDNEKNPTADAHYVFVPYCTGDVHSGDAVVELEGLFPWEKETIHFKGHHNMKRYLTRLAPTFQDVDRVIMMGASAGGFGALLNWSAVKAAFPGKRLDVIDDSGPPIVFDGEMWAQWRDTWNIQLPDGCPECGESIGAALEFALASLLPGGRFALVSYNRDTIIATFLGLLPGTFKERLGDLCEILDGEDSAQYFVMSGLAHTPTIFVAGTAKAEDDTPLWQWLQAMQSDDEDWPSHKP